MAEREGFEPPIRLPVCRISSAVLSTAQPPLQDIDMTYSFHICPHLKNAIATEIATELFYFSPLSRALAVWNAASSLAAASVCIVSVTWEYKSIVVVMVE